ncbi:MAG: FGGY-family carbohydrate kinase [Rhodospirillales bacterium]
MAIENFVIGVDIGTQSTKALICDANGKVAAQASVAYQPETPLPFWAEQDARVWFDAVVGAIAEAVAKLRAANKTFTPDQLKSVCISGLYGGAGIPVDADMRPLYPCLIWMDRRAETQVDWVRKNVDLDRLRDITGNHVDSYYGFTKILWIRDNKPEVWAQTCHFLPPNAWIIYELTGELAVDHSSAGNIGGVYDLKARAWSEELLAELGIPRSMMPDRLVASSDVVGGLKANIAARLGLAAGTPIVAGGVDAAVATFAAGATRRGRHVAMIGTSMCWGFIAPAVDTRGGLISMPHVFDGARDTYVFGGAATAGASVAWFVEQLAPQLASAGETYAALEAVARELSPCADGLIFLPYLMGERSPVWDGRASGAFVGLTLAHGRAHLYRAVLEGVSFALRHNIDALPDATLDHELIIVGGAAKSQLWLQIIADMTGRPILTISEEVEAAMGAALLAALGVGLASREQALKGWVTLREAARPRLEATQSYDRAFAIYKALYPALRGAMHGLHDVARQARKDTER